MNPVKRNPWRVRVFILLALIVLGASMQAAPEPPDPIVGDWLYSGEHPVSFQADGTALWQGGGHGTWEFQHNPEVQRHYRIVWEHGQSIDALVLAEDGQHARVRNLTGGHSQYEIRRATPDKPAAHPVSPAPSP